MKRSPRVPNKERGVKTQVWARVGWQAKLAVFAKRMALSR